MIQTEGSTAAVQAGGKSVGFDAPMRKLGEEKISYDILRLIPEESAEHYKLAPLSVTDGVLEVGMVNPDDIRGIDALNFIARSTGMPFKVYRISKEDFERILNMYRGLGGEVERAVVDLTTEEKERPKDVDA